MKTIVALCALLFLVSGCGSTKDDAPMTTETSTRVATPNVPPMVPKITPTPRTIASPQRTSTIRPTTRKPSPAESTSEREEPYYTSCKVAKAAGAAPLHRGEPGYRSGLDKDGDGVACE